MKNGIWTVLGVIGAVVVAWLLVDVVFSLVWLLAKLLVVALVAVVVFVLLRNALGGSRDD
ncbi:hypothetical protein GCM10023169_31460 [Georgenia halophila]|uniref:Flagellar biosynthesis protein FlhA n=1 Tax=Georgenia halophila TaxID=620889 RepID=A0ABP8LJ87_9MICO